MDPEEARTLYDELSRRHSAWLSAALAFITTSLSAGAANHNDVERAELAEAIPSLQMTEQDLKQAYQEYRAQAQQRLFDAYGNLVATIAETLAQHDPYNLVARPDGPESDHRMEGSLSDVPNTYSDMALWLALLLPEATTKKDIEVNLRQVYDTRPALRGRRNRSKRKAIASSIWEVWQSAEV